MTRVRYISRRDVLRNGALGLGALVVLSCKKHVALTCADVSGLSAEDIVARRKLAYTDVANDARRACANCQQFVSPTEDDRCGGCKILKGPIHPGGTCKAYVART